MARQAGRGRTAQFRRPNDDCSSSGSRWKPTCTRDRVAIPRNLSRQRRTAHARDPGYPDSSGPRLKGHDAIRYASERGRRLSKYADPTEDAPDGLSVPEAREVAAEDAGLIFLDLSHPETNARDG